MELGFYKVTVTVSVEQENGKTKKHKELYLVTDCGSTQTAADTVTHELKDYTSEWMIEKVQVEKLDGILSSIRKLNTVE